ncbi:MAG: DUF975 family protein [Eubacteriales bacterium]
MQTHQTSSQLKSSAKGLLLGKYNLTIMATLLPEIIILLVATIASTLVDDRSIVGMVISYTISFILTLIGGIFTVGQLYIYMKIYCNTSTSITEVFYGFKTHPDKAIIIKFIPLLLTVICIIPFGIMIALYMMTNSTIFMLLSSIALILGGIVAVVIQLQFSQAFYLLLDFPDKEAKELLLMSRSLMNGHKGRLFYIYVSFLPLLLLAFFTFGFGFLFIIPYMTMTCTGFYFNLVQVKNTPIQQNLQSESLDA